MKLELGRKAPTLESGRYKGAVRGHFERVELRIVWREVADDTYSRGKWWGIGYLFVKYQYVDRLDKGMGGCAGGGAGRNERRAAGVEERRTAIIARN